MLTTCRSRIAAATLIVFPFQNSGVEGGNWSSVKFIAPLVFGILSLAALFVWQWFAERKWKGKIAATLPMELLRNRVYSVTVLHSCLTGFPYFVAIYAFPMRFQVVNRKNPFEAGLMLLPMLAATSIGSLLGGAINSKRNRLAETLAAACGLMLIGCALETTAASGEYVEAKVLGFLVFLGVGFGLSASGATMVGIFESPVREHGKFVLFQSCDMMLTNLHSNCPGNCSAGACPGRQHRNRRIVCHPERQGTRRRRRGRGVF